MMFYKDFQIIKDNDEMFPFFVPQILHYSNHTCRFRTLSAAKCAISKLIKELLNES